MVVYFLVSFLASIAGAICGIGGGVVIKPVLDLVGMDTVAAISFLSGCTVLSMSCYSVIRSVAGGGKTVDVKTATPLAIGAAVGGIVGKWMFDAVSSLASNQGTVGSIQSICLAVISAATLVYTIFKARVKTKDVQSNIARVIIGMLLGIMSSFLGIGGGPINLVVLFYFFSMDTKTAAANSLYIILFSQIASLVSTFVTGSVPDVSPVSLVLMVAGGLLGGIFGRIFNRKMSTSAVDKLFIVLMVVIIGISIYNFINYSSAAAV